MGKSGLRPVSGELLVSAASTRRADPHGKDDSILDAEFETLVRASGRRSGLPAAGAPAGVAGLEILRRGRGLPRDPSRAGRAILWIGALLLVAGAFWVSGGHAAFGQAATIF
ncbi:hypothetical protein [Chelativorans sp. AA-79]|uniref:hypothetical protein n=1 Tax=Chelativorans sp. AA-79 TaxID=3028735 RepID=UPI0023F6DB68|nr:hypothetical protein [Chelativorans sp. AA-79]WEX10056.1 hypothetical protein PVE73_03560 [Chelativorans sp. AA-79]